MDQKPSRVPFFVGIAFVVGVVVFAWVTRRDEGATQRAVAHVVAPENGRDSGR